MKPKRCIGLLAVISLMLSTLGCFLDVPRFYIASYRIEAFKGSSELSRANYIEVVDQLCQTCTYEKGNVYDRRQGIFIDLSSPNKKPDSVKLITGYFDAQKVISITILRNGVEETAEAVRARKCVESTLEKHKDWRVQFFLSHSTMSR